MEKRKEKKNMNKKLYKINRNNKKKIIGVSEKKRKQI